MEHYQRLERSLVSYPPLQRCMCEHTTARGRISGSQTSRDVSMMSTIRFKRGKESQRARFGQLPATVVASLPLYSGIDQQKLEAVLKRSTIAPSAHQVFGKSSEFFIPLDLLQEEHSNSKSNKGGRIELDLIHYTSLSKMAQESLKNEIEETECQKCESPSPCTNNCGFFGSSMTNNLCSKCYRDLIMKKHQAMLVSHPTTSVSSSTIIELISNETEKLTVEIVDNLDKKEPEEPSINHRSNRCSFCRKRVGLTGFQCRCGSTFCSTHRYPETHECSFNFKNAGQEAITKDNPVVKADKIVKI